MTTITVTDRATMGAKSQRVMTDEGYMRAPAIVSRTGIQVYYSDELGLDGPVRPVKVYRPADEVFSSDSLASFEDKDVTIDHPNELVNAKTYKQVSAGHITSTGRRDGDTVVADILIKDQDAIDAIKRGKAEVSCGYTAIYDFTPGTTPEGEDYDAVQRDIRINHLALVSRGRAGNARVLDRQPKEAITMYHITHDGARVASVDDESKAALIQHTVDGLHQKAKDAQAALDSATSELDAAKATADAATKEVAELKAKTTDAAIEARVKSVMDAMSHARQLAGADFSCDSVDPMTIKRAAMASVDAERDWSADSDAYVSAYFDIAMKSKATADAAAAAAGQAAKDSVSSVGKELAGAQPVEDSAAKRKSAHQAFLDARYGKKEAK